MLTVLFGPAARDYYFALVGGTRWEVVQGVSRPLVCLSVLALSVWRELADPGCG